jgi:hypothetical protein
MRSGLITKAMIAAGLVLRAPLPAAAQPAVPGRGAAQAATKEAPGGDDADAHFRRGNELYKQQRWAEAEAAFEEAFRRKKVHDIAANLAYAEMKQGKHREAAEHLAFAVRSWPPTGKEDKRRYAEERLAQVKKEVATLKIRVSVPDAEVLVGGVKVGTSPLEGEVFVEPGAPTVEARKAGYREAKQVVQAARGAEVTVDLVLEAQPATPAEAAAAPEPQPGGIVPSVAPRIDTSQAEGPVDESRGGGPRKELLIAGGAVAGAALVAGVVLTVVANGKAADRDAIAGWERCYEAGMQVGLPDCARVDELRHGAADLGSAAFWSFVGAGVIGGATVAYAVITWPRDKSARQVGVAPAAAAGGGAVWVSGRF